MARKHRRKPIHKLRGSFVATFSLAAGLGGCGVADQPPSREMEVATGGVGVITNPPGFSGVGGAGAGGVGGAGGSMGPAGFGAANPPGPTPGCPAEVPQTGHACDSIGSCLYNYNGPHVDPCDNQTVAKADCNSGAWSVIILESTCNPPEIFDAAIIDEDAGQD